MFRFKKIIFLFLFTRFCSLAFAQRPQGDGPKPTIGKIKGSVQDFKGKIPVQFATVALYKRKDTALVTGAVANEKGEFELSQLEFGRYFMKVNFIGYKLLVIDTIKISPRMQEINLGTILLHSASEQLEEVEVSAERSTVQLGIDRKIFNVEKSIVSNGGSATDVLQTIPSVSVDIDGNISLRGSGNVTVLVDGRPSSITGSSRAAILQQIPASSIESIELITNPSAKYDPDGMSGIINIVLKKNKTNGFNGNVSVSVGTFDKYSGSVNVSYRNTKINVYANYGYRLNNRTGKGYSIRQNSFADTSYFLNSKNTQRNKNESHNVKAGLDFYLDDKNTLGFSVLYNTGAESSRQPWEYWEENASNQAVATYQRLETSSETPTSIDYNMNFRRTFAKPKKEFSMDATYSNGSNNNEDDLFGSNYTGKYAPLNSRPLNQLTNTKGENSVTNIQIDFTQPLKYNMKWEAGAKTILRKIDSRFISKSFDYNHSDFAPDTALNNIFNYDENLFSAYSTLGGIIKKFGYQLGLRAEQANTTSHLVSKGQDFENNYFSLFPSVHLSQKLRKNQEIGLSYSRRINRPGTRSLNPFRDVSDPYNIRYGNPFLKPEYINSYELSYMKYWQKAVLTTSVYYRKTDGIIQRIKTLGDSTISYTTFTNLNSSQSYGFELIAKNDLTKWWNTTASVNIFQTVIDGSNVDADLQSNSFSYLVKLMSNMHIWKNMDIQVSGNYNGPSAFAGGTMKEMYSIDFGIKKEIFRNAYLSMNINDVTDSRRYAFDASGTNYTMTMLRKRESRVATFTFMYRFGKASENKRAKQKPANNDSDNSGGDQGGL